MTKEFQSLLNLIKKDHTERPKGKPVGSKNFDEPTQTFVSRFPVSLHKSLRKYAKENGLSMGEVVRSAVKERMGI